MSVTVNINLEGTEEFQQAISRFDTEMQNQVQAKLAGWAETVQKEAERLVPVRTGYLRSTIYVKTRQWQMQVGAEAAYAAAVEFGTRNSRAKPYLTPTVQSRLPELQAVISEALNQAKTEANL